MQAGRAPGRLLLALCSLGAACQFARPTNIDPIDASTPGFMIEPIALSWVRGGDSIDVAVRVVRDPGFDAAITLSLVNPPTGVTTRGAEIPPGSTDGLLPVGVGLDAGVAGSSVELTVAADGGRGAQQQTTTLRVKGGFGALDEAFGVLGIAATSSPQFGGYLRLGARHLVAAGADVWAFDDAGQPDLSFGIDGVLTPVPASVDPMSARQVFIVPAQSGRFKVVVSGDMEQGSGVRLGGAVMQFAASGDIDPSFPARSFSLPGSFSIGVVVGDDTGAIYVGGEHDTGVEVEAAVARLLPTGSRDLSFGSSGYLRWSGAIVTALWPTGARVIIAVSGLSNARLYGVDPHGIADVGFGGDGEVAIDDLVALSGCELLAPHLSSTPTGGLWVAGLTCLATTPQGAAIRLSAEGNVDSTFSGDGVWLGLADELGVVHSITSLLDGSLMVVGAPRADASHTSVYHLADDGTPLLDVGASGVRDLALRSGAPTTTSTESERPYVFVAGLLADHAAIARVWY